MKDQGTLYAKIKNVRGRSDGGGIRMTWLEFWPEMNRTLAIGILKNQKTEFGKHFDLKNGRKSETGHSLIVRLLTLTFTERNPNFHRQCHFWFEWPFLIWIPFVKYLTLSSLIRVLKQIIKSLARIRTNN